LDHHFSDIGSVVRGKPKKVQSVELENLFPDLPDLTKQLQAAAEKKVISDLLRGMANEHAPLPDFPGLLLQRKERSTNTVNYNEIQSIFPNNACLLK